MKYCAYCGHPLADMAQYCEKCGAPTRSDAALLKEEKEFLDNTHRFLKYERVAWSVLGTIILVLGILYFAFDILILAGFAGLVLSEVPGSSLGLGLVALLLGACSLLFIAMAIVGLVSAKKIRGYMDGMYYDIRPAANRCTSVGMLILSIFFNKIAMIFFIINFARFKGNKQVVERIIQRQQGQL